MVSKDFKEGYILGRKDKSKKFREYIKSHWANWLWWFFFVYVVLDIISNLHTLQRWKWGYWSIDLIPDTIFLLILYFINIHRRISRLEKAQQQEVKE